MLDITKKGFLFKYRNRKKPCMCKMNKECTRLLRFPPLESKSFS